MKTGDAKLWVYHHTSDHDRQASEDDKEGPFGIIRLAYHKSGFFIRMGSPTFRRIHRPEGFFLEEHCRIVQILRDVLCVSSQHTASLKWEVDFL